MEKETLYVRLMGEIRLTCGEHTVEPAREAPLQAMQFTVAMQALQLLSALLYFNKSGVPKEKLLAGLYGEENADSATLDELCAALRASLQRSGIPAGDCIVSDNGVYRFGDAFTVQTDTDDFQRALAAADAAEEAAEKAIGYARACEIYGGVFLPLCAEQPWVSFVDAELTDGYVRAASWLCRYYRSQKSYEALCELCRRASLFFPNDEEWHVLRLNGLIAMEQYKLAMEECSAITSMLFEEQGVYPSEQILDCAKSINDKISFDPTDGADVAEMLQDIQPAGAYYCSYPSFVDSYHILKRIMDRDRVPSCLILCTVTDEARRPIKDRAEAAPAMQKLRLALAETLRKSDLYTRYSCAQMLVMLWGTGPENLSGIVERLNELMCERGMPEGQQMVYTVLTGAGEPRFIQTAIMDKDAPQQ